MTRRTVALGVGLGLCIAAVYITVDVTRRRDDAQRIEASTLPSATTPPAAAAAPSASASASPSGSAAPAASSSAAPSAPARPGMIEVAGATYQPTFLTHTVDVKTFFLDETEVSQKAYLTCVEAAACPPTPWAKVGEKLEPAAERLPAGDVGWGEAVAHCKWAKKRLPTEVEWEFAARGTEGRKYPWGEDTPSDQLCWRVQAPCEIGTFPRGGTPQGIKDLAGGVWEWVAEERFCPNPDRAETCDPQRHVARGGAWNVTNLKLLEGAYRNAFPAMTKQTGFRCAAD